MRHRDARQGMPQLKIAHLRPRRRPRGAFAHGTRPPAPAGARAGRAQQRRLGRRGAGAHRRPRVPTLPGLGGRARGTHRVRGPPPPAVEAPGSTSTACPRSARPRFAGPGPMDTGSVSRVLVVSAAADRRPCERAFAWLAGRRRDEEVLILGTSLEAPAEIVRRPRSSAAPRSGGPGARSGAPRPRSPEAGAGRARPGPRGRAAARGAGVARGRRASAATGRSVASTPGWRASPGSRALARTVAELRLAGIDPEAMGPEAPRRSPGSTGRLRGRFHPGRPRGRAPVFRLAAAAAREAATQLPILPGSTSPSAAALERDLVAALVARAPEVLAVVPEGDERSLDSLTHALGVAPERVPAGEGGSLRRLQAHLFSGEAAPPAPQDHHVEVLSAPGESRECVEIARLVQREAGRGVPFDRMAILLRAPAQYRAHLRAVALRRASVPAHFARGTVQARSWRGAPSWRSSPAPPRWSRRGASPSSCRSARWPTRATTASPRRRRRPPIAGSPPTRSWRRASPPTRRPIPTTRRGRCAPSRRARHRIRRPP